MPKNPRGSEWRRWDLHVHSPLSILNNNFPFLPDGGGPDWEAYIHALESAPVAVYGITDYFTIDGYKELKRRQAEGRLSNVRLLPNIEFRLDQIVSSRHDGSNPRRLNFHVIFSEEVSTEDIEDHFLSELKFVYQEDPTNASEALSLKPANLVRLGERLIREHAEFGNTASLVVGANNAVVPMQKILDKLRGDSRFSNKYLIVLPADGWDNIPWSGQDHQVRKTMLQASDFVFVSNPKTIQWCLGLPPYGEGEESFKKEFRTLKPCIHGSDAHSVAEIAMPCAKRSVAEHSCDTQSGECELRKCWIKADPTFEGLRQVLYEPAERIKIQTNDPTPSKTRYCIDQLEVADTPVNPELHLVGASIPLNHGLVAITGGRGSGKTALVDLIAHCFVDRVNSTDKNSFVRRVKDAGASFATTLTFLGGDRFSKTLLDGRFVEDSNLVYIAQGELEQYIGEGSDLNKYVHSLVFNSEEVRNSTVVYEYESIADEVRVHQQSLDEVNQNIHQLELATADTVLADLKKAGKQARAEVEDLTKRVADAASKLTPEKVDATQARQQTLDVLKAKRQALSAAKATVQEAAHFATSDLVRFGQMIRNVNAAVAALSLGEEFPTLSYVDSERLRGIADAIDRQMREVLLEIERHEKELRSLATEQKDHATLLNKKRESETKLEEVKAQWKAVTVLQGTLGAKRAARSAGFSSLLLSILEQRKKYDEIIQKFSTAKDRVLSDLDFRAEIGVNESALLSSAADLLDNRQTDIEGSHGPATFQALMGLSARLPIEGEALLEPMVAEVDGLALTLRDKIKKGRSVDPLQLYKLLYRSYFVVEPVVRYKNVSLEHLSLGQKATVLMKIYLAEGDMPIIIDSHDDHLDNESIMDELVGSIRQAKQYRQVILASNNGNVVINSDADQLLIAQRTGGEITYISGSLENEPIRERALRVLEGGLEAFRRRQEKYRLGR